MSDLITIDPVQAGQRLSAALTKLSETDAIEEAHGELCAGLARIQCQVLLRETMADPLVRALVLAGSGLTYEVCESDNYKIPDDDKITAVIMALSKGYRLSDPSGHHFAIIKGKGPVNMMPKEAGYRHQLLKLGAKDVDVQASAVRMESRKNDPNKMDMILIGYASCQIGDRRYMVERTELLPMRLPCYPTDGPDGHEAKGRRRLLRDLWQKVSGVCEMADEAEAITAQVSLEAITAGEETQVDPYEPYRDEMQAAGKVAKAISRKLFGAATQSQVKAIMDEADAARADGMDQRDYDRLERFAKFHLTQIG